MIYPPPGRPDRRLCVLAHQLLLCLWEDVTDRGRAGSRAFPPLPMMASASSGVAAQVSAMVHTP